MPLIFFSILMMLSYIINHLDLILFDSNIPVRLWFYRGPFHQLHHLCILQELQKISQKKLELPTRDKIGSKFHKQHPT